MLREERFGWERVVRGEGWSKMRIEKATPDGRGAQSGDDVNLRFVLIKQGEGHRCKPCHLSMGL